MRIESSTTSVSWIPSEAVTGLNKGIFDSGFTHYDPPPPEGAVEGVVEGIVEGVIEGTPEGVVEGVVDGTTEGVAEGVVEGTPEDGADVGAGLLGFSHGGSVEREGEEG